MRVPKKTIGLVLLASLMVGPIQMANAQSPGGQAVGMLENNLAVAASKGDQEAADSLKKLRKLSTSKKAELGSILAGEGVLAESEKPDSKIETLRVDCGVASKEAVKSNATSASRSAASPMATARAATIYNVTTTCDQKFLFLGINITQTRVTGKYQTQNQKVIKTTKASGSVIKSYEPGASISFSEDEHYRSGAKGIFKVRVTVTRSIFGWNHSTRSGVQVLRVNGKDREACFWE